MAKTIGTQAQTIGDLYLNAQNKKSGSAGDTDWTDVLAEVPLFSNLSARHVRNLAKLAKIQRLAAFTQIVRQGESGDAFFLILDGTAVVRPPGKRVVKLGPGDFFGELALLDDSPRSATVEAQEDILLARIGRRDFTRMLDKEPKVAVALLRTLTARLRASEASAQH
ncbi:MAG: family transcriptional regulator, cyclic receptor protein [Nocardioidaceae bacterium]|jgi:CRP-like cAMP-binding protein|nr:family transcriptional regulator, cyclic receptor protein [Nocardioidaceae bacterium]